MYPIFSKTFFCSCLALGNFIFVVYWDVIYTSGMNIKTITQIFHTHSRTLNMPSRESLPPRRGPFHGMILKFSHCKKPQSKIRRMFFLRINYYFFSGAGFLLLQILTGQLAISGKFGNVKINGFICLVSKTFFDQLFNKFNLLANVFGGPAN